MPQISSTSLSAVFDIPLLANLPPWAESLVALAILLSAAWFANFIVKHIVLRFAMRWLPDDGPSPAPIAARLANIVPALIISSGIGSVPHLPPAVAVVVSNVVAASIILFVAMAISKALGLANEIYDRRPGAVDKAIGQA